MTFIIVLNHLLNLKKNNWAKDYQDSNNTGLNQVLERIDNQLKDTCKHYE